MNRKLGEKAANCLLRFRPETRRADLCEIPCSASQVSARLDAFFLAYFENILHLDECLTIDAFVMIGKKDLTNITLEDRFKKSLFTSLDGD